jgi:hypothetical protein
MTITSYASQAHFNNYDAPSFGWSQGIPPLVPFSFGGTNFGQVARDAAPVFTALLTELVPHIPGGINFGPHDDWGFATTDDLAGGVWSFHHRGLAIDLNWNDNPMFDGDGPNPHAGEKGAIPHALASTIATKYGCEYGGDWNGFKDYMHFEVHLSPSIARTVKLIIPPQEALMVTEDDLKKVKAVVLDVVRDAFKDYTTDDSDPVGKQSPGHFMKTIISNEIQQAIPTIASAVTKAATPAITAAVTKAVMAELAKKQPAPAVPNK